MSCCILCGWTECTTDCAHANVAITCAAVLWCSLPSLALPLCEQWEQWLRAMHLFLFKMHREWQLWCDSSCQKSGMCATSMPWNCAASGKKPPIVTVVCFDVYVPDLLNNVLGCSSWEHETVVTQEDWWSCWLFLELLYSFSSQYLGRCVCWN